MNYTKEERMEIGRQIYTHEITIGDADEKYSLNWYTVRDYMRQYRDLNHLPPMSNSKDALKVINKAKKKNAASQYTVPYSLVYQWTKKYLERGKDALKDSRGKPSSNEHKELTELEKKDIEIEKLKLERHKWAEEILKKT